MRTCPTCMGIGVAGDNHEEHQRLLVENKRIDAMGHIVHYDGTDDTRRLIEEVFHLRAEALDTAAKEYLLEKKIEELRAENGKLKEEKSGYAFIAANLHGILREARELNSFACCCVDHGEGIVEECSSCRLSGRIDSVLGLKDCVCGEINTKHCPVHQLGEKK